MKILRTVADVREHLDVAVVKKTNLITVSYKQRGVDPTGMERALCRVVLRRRL